MKKKLQMILIRSLSIVFSLSFKFLFIYINIIEPITKERKK